MMTWDETSTALETNVLDYLPVSTEQSIVSDISETSDAATNRFDGVRAEARNEILLPKAMCNVRKLPQSVVRRKFKRRVDQRS